jgi:cyclic-di-GMP-binding protein
VLAPQHGLRFARIPKCRTIAAAACLGIRVLGWFSTGKVDHPLAEAKESLRTVADLPKDTLKAMGEIAFWLDSINSTEGFRLDRRFDLVDEFDQAARLHVRKLAQEYLQLRQQKFQENRLWTALSEFWRLTGAGYVQCIEGFQADAAGSGAIKGRVPLIVGRALYAISQQFKWLLLRYGPVENSLWADLGRLYAFAEAKGFAETPVLLQEGSHGESSARKEFLKTAMLSVASADSLLPEKIEIAERTVSFFARHYLLERSPMSACTHVFELAMRRPPTRMKEGSGGDGSARYFGAGPAYDEISRLLGVVLAEGVLPSDVNLGAQYEPQAVIDVWRHVLQYWSPKPPERGSARHAANVRLTVVPGFQRLTRILGASPDDSLDFSSVAAGAGTQSESWIAENASDGGYGALVPATRSDWVQVGSLLGVRAEGEKHWGVGVVRRMLRDGEQNRRVGIQLLARVAVPVRLAPTGVISSFNATRDNDPAVLLTPKPGADRQIRLLLRAGGYTRDQALEMRVHGQAFRITPVKLLESSVEFDEGLFALVERIS